MEIVMKAVGDITPYANNPRKNANAVEPVANSIKEFGFRVPILIDADNVIVAGHTRLEAAKRLGMDEVPCIMVGDLTEEQTKAYRLVDNKTAELSGWDFELLGLELDGIGDMFDMGDFGFDFIQEIRGGGSEPDRKDINRELDLDDFGEEAFEHECPRCGFRF